ncbi:MAG: tetratricopeptide repeat protein [Acidobacteriota bacterium]
MKVRAAALAAVWLCAAVSAVGQDLLARAQSLVRDGKLDEALPLIQRFLKERPASAEAHAVLGFIFFRQSKPSEALREYSEAAKYRKPTAFESKIAGLSHAMLEDYSSADRDLTRALELNPKDLQTCNYLGEVRFLRERYEETVAAFRHCLTLDARNVFAQNGIGSAFEQMQRLDDAAAAYRKAIEWQPAESIYDPTPVLNLGRVLLKQNRSEEALPYLTRAVELAPDHAGSHEQLSKAHSRVNDLDAARREVEKAIELKPDDYRLHYVLGRLFQNAGMRDKAQREFEIYRALKKRTEDPRP